MPALLAGDDGLEVDEVERPVADVLPLAQLQEDGVGRLSTNLTLINFPIQLSVTRIANSRGLVCIAQYTRSSRFQRHKLQQALF